MKGDPLGLKNFKGTLWRKKVEKKSHNDKKTERGPL